MYLLCPNLISNCTLIIFSSILFAQCSLSLKRLSSSVLVQDSTNSEVRNSVSSLKRLLPKEFLYSNTKAGKLFHCQFYCSKQLNAVLSTEFQQAKCTSSVASVLIKLTMASLIACIALVIGGKKIAILFSISCLVIFISHD